MAALGASDAKLAAHTGLPHDLGADIVLEHSAGRLQLRDTRPRAPGPLWVDLQSPATESRRRAGKGLLLARACGVKRGKPAPGIIDATAGLGRDAYALAALGCCVIAVECSPVVHALLEDGLARAGDEAAGRILLRRDDAIGLLPGLPVPDVIYIDPMFPDDGRTALSKKEMQYFRAVLGDAQDARPLLNSALGTGARRVVLKRPRVSPTLGKPALVFKGKSIRFDVYLQ